MSVAEFKECAMVIFIPASSGTTSGGNKSLQQCKQNSICAYMNVVCLNSHNNQDLSENFLISFSNFITGVNSNSNHDNQHIYYYYHHSGNFVWNMFRYKLLLLGFKIRRFKISQVAIFHHHNLFWRLIMIPL